MIKRYCDVCNKEIKGSYFRIEIGGDYSKSPYEGEFCSRACMKKRIQED